MKMDINSHLSYLSYKEDCLKKGIVPEPEIPLEISNNPYVLGSKADIYPAQEVLPSNTISKRFMGENRQKIIALIENSGLKRKNQIKVYLNRLSGFDYVAVGGLIGKKYQPKNRSSLRNLEFRVRKFLKPGFYIETEKNKPYRRKLISLTD
ncbi:hypothetical protein A2634_03100 [Candidatus Amesbacteria bacterium RIFCSPHIGHO2_01_FULL_48_32]|uniref:Uncharacterized protein n=1 Tax=Candidatus Amesbacteria bacterium RIFCSPLOWO2_01_FULL_48_25 TaxID=1797259 RepID=A0A1F4ZDV7_9BACT|nr:MAG: hypothetical protein A2634_03100 [Candidatus Amesbacteria bacterium RIFCSPHIGHO2_01_FULL_48_32]OGD03604.1 MAG: hypothetical protein A2989_02890 [Candidatus Amesbacteria bacterium RIFCSPLOWO2_01_FULL_48_25]HJZ04434.1 hypothetical protein [Patescibacteria group bacterium]